GSGKSTSLASLINHINESYAHHIVTIEDPIEFVHTDKKCSITQREVGLDTESFRDALRYVLRQDPDVILIGEMRDADTVGTAISAAETGHMVFSTLHTMDTIQTINRILDFFPKEQQPQIRVQLAGALRAVISLRLVTKTDGVGRVPAVEILVATKTVKGYMEEGKIGSIKDLIKNGEQEGMQTFDQSLIKLFKQGLITLEEAKRNATSVQEIDLAMKGISSSGNSAQSILDSMMKEQTTKELKTVLNEAKKFISQHRFKEAYVLYEKMNGRYPGNEEVKEGMDYTKRMIGKAQQSQNVKGIIMEGVNIYKKGNIKGAILKWQEGLEQDPENAQLKSYIKSAKEKEELAGKIPEILKEGIEIYKTGDVKGAIAKWNEIIEIDPQNPQAHSYITGAQQKLMEMKKKKELEMLVARGKQEADKGDELEAVISFKQAKVMDPDNEEIKAAYEEVYNKLMAESFGEDVDASIAQEAFAKGVNSILEENYFGAIKELKKAIEKRPLDKKLKDYVEKIKKVMSKRLNRLMEKADEAYRQNDISSALMAINIILKIDPSNEFALKYLRDLKPMIDEECSRHYKEGMDCYAIDKLREAQVKFELCLNLDPNHMSAKSRLDEIKERLEEPGA
ncbi:MAG: PilT/PilU family type 4a pilus ATPase, partial [bacterium]